MPHSDIIHVGWNAKVVTIKKGILIYPTVLFILSRKSSFVVIYGAIFVNDPFALSRISELTFK